jgi:hypothetical protein
MLKTLIIMGRWEDKKNNKYSMMVHQKNYLGISYFETNKRMIDRALRIIIDWIIILRNIRKNKSAATITLSRIGLPPSLSARRNWQV